MAGGGEASVRVPINLEIVNNSLTDIKKVLDSLSPNTKNFEALKTIVADMEKSAAAFAQKMAVPFKSKSQFTSAGKDLDKFMVQMEKFNKLRRGLELGDFKVVDPASLQQIENLKKQLEDAQKEIVKIQEQTLQGLFNNADVNGALVKIDPDITKKSFEEVEEIVNEKVDEINEKIAKIGSENNKAIDIGNKLKEIVGKDFISSDVLGEDVFNKFFKKNGAFKAGQQNPFVEYLTETFNLTPDQVSKLKDQSASKINEILNETFKNGNRKFFKSQTMQATAAEKGSADLVNDQQILAALQQVQNAFNTAGQQSEQYRQALINLKNAMDGVTQSGQKQGQAALGINYDAMAQAVQSYKASLESAQGSLMKLNRQQAAFNSLKAAITNFMGFTQVLNLVKKGVSDAASHIKELDAVMNGISIVTDMSTADLWGQVDAYTQLAQKYGTTIKGAYEVSQIYYQQGLKSNEVMSLTEETLKLSKISGLDYATTTDYMTTALRGFHMEMEEASRVVDVYSALAANTAVSQQELAEAMTRTASSMEAIGTTFEEASAMIATMVAATRESASNIGSAMKSIGSRYGELTKDPTKLMDSEGEEISFNKVDAALKSVGISMQTADHQFRSFTEVILELSEAWDTLDSRQQRYIATQMAGNRQQSRFLALVSNEAELRRNLEIAENSEGTGSEQALKYLDSLEAKLNQVQTAWQEFYTTIGIEEAWKGFLDNATQVLNTLNGLPKAFNKIPIAAIGAIATIINAVKTLGTAALGGLSKMIIPYVLAAGQAAEAVAGQEGLKGGQKYNEEFQKALNGLSGGIASKIAGIFTVAAGALNTLALTMDTTEPKGRKLAGTLASVSVALQGISAVISFIKKDYVSGIMSLVGAFTSGMTAFGLFNESTEEKLNRLKENSDNLKNTAQQLKSEERSLTTLKKKYDELEEHRYDSEEAAQAYQEAVNELAEKFPQLVSSYDSLGNATIEAKTLEEALAEARLAAAKASTAAAEGELAYQKAKGEEDKRKLQEEQATLLSNNERALKNQYGNQVPLEWMSYLSPQGKKTIDSSMILGQQNNEFKTLTDEGWLLQVIGAYLLKNTNSTNERKNINTLLATSANSANHKAEENLPQIIQLYEDLESEHQSPFLNRILKERQDLMEYNKITKELLNTSYDDPKYQELFNQWQTTYTSIMSLLSDTQQALADKIRSTVVQGQLGLITAEQTVKSLEKTATQDALNTLIEKDNLLDLKDSNLYSVVSHKLLNGVANRDTDANGNQISFETYVSKYEEDIKSLNSWLNSLNAYERQQFEERLKDRRHYNTYSKLTYGLELKNAPTFSNGQSLEQFINDYYDEEKVQARAQQNIKGAQEKANKNKYSGVSQSLGKINTTVINTAAEEQFNNQLINLTETLGKYNPNVDLDLTGVSESFSLLSNELQDKLLDNGLLTIEAVENSMQALEAAGQKDSAIYDFLDKTKSKLVNNLLLSIQTELDAYTKGADTAISNIKKLQSGVGFEDLSKILTTLNQYLDDTTGQLNIDDFDFVDGNWTIKLDSLEKATTGYTKQMSEFDKDFEEQMQTFSKARELIQQINKEQPVSDISILADANITDIGKYLTWNGTTYEWNDKEHSSEELSKILDDNEKLAIQQNELYKAYKESYKANLLQLGNDYKRIDKTLTSIISNRKDIQLTDVTKLKNLLGFTDIQQMIDKDFIKWTGDHYEATAEQLQKMLDQSVTTGKLTDVSQINTLQAQIDKLAQESSLETAFRSIVASQDDITEEMLAAYATALNTTTDKIRYLFTQKQNGHYRIDNLENFLNTEGAGLGIDDFAGEYANKIREATISVYNSFVSAFTSGEVQYIADTAENRDALKELPKGIATFSNEYQKWIIDTSNQSTEEIIKALQYSNLTQEQKTKNIDSVLKAEQSKNFNTVFSTILKDTDNISRDVMQKLADNLQTSVEILVNTGAFDFDTKNQTYKVQDKGYLKSILESSADKLSESAYRSLEAQLYVLDNEFNGQAMSFLSNTSIKETDVADILNKYQENTCKNLLDEFGLEVDGLTDFINTYFTRDINGNLQIKDNAAFKELAGKLNLSQEQIQNILVQRISNIISNFSSLTTDAINGFDSIDKANTVLQNIRTEYNVNFSDIFDYSQSLHKFVYRASGIALRVKQLKEQLESGASEEEQEQINAQLTSLMSQIGQGIDITGYRQLEVGTIEWQKAQKELIRNINNYNAAAEAAGKMSLDIDLVNSAIDGNLHDLQFIYELLGKELSTNELTDIYREPVTSILNAINTLEENGVGSLIDSSMAAILELTGAITTTNSEISGKNIITGIKFDELADAYLTLYNTLDASNKATVKELNDVAAKIAKSQVTKETASIELLTNAASMTIDQFVDIFSNLGYTLDKNFLSKGQFGDYIKSLGGENIEIFDLNGLINYTKNLGLDLSAAFDTEKGKEALKSYGESMISQANSISDRIMSLASELENAENGDLINVADLLKDGVFGDTQIKNGIIEIDDNIKSIIEVLINQYGQYLSEYEKSVLRAIDTKHQAAELSKQTSASKTLIENWDNASYEMIEAFAEAFHYNINDVLADFISNGDGTYKGTRNKGDFARAYMTDKYIQEMNRGIDNIIKETFSSVISAGIDSLNSGEQRIVITDENRAIIDELYEAGAGEINSNTREFCIHVTEDSIQSFISIIQSATGLNQSEKNQYIEQLYSRLQENTTDALLNNMMSNYDNLGYELVAKLKDNTIVNNVLGSAIKFNETTQTHFLDIKQAYDILSNINSLDGLDNTTFNSLKTSVITAYSSISPQTLIESVISSRENITEEMISNLEKNIEGLPENFRDQLTQVGLGKYKMGTSLAIQLAKAANIQNIEQIFASELISNLSNLSSEIINGFTDISSMQKIADTISDYTGSDLDVGFIFDYSEAAQSFFLSTEAMVKYITIIKKQMQEAGINQEVIDGQIQSLLTNLGNAIDFSNVFTFKDTDINSQLRSQAILTKQIRDYRQMMLQEGKLSRLNDDVIEALFSGGDNAVAAAGAVYMELGKELSTELAQQIYQYPLTKLTAGYEALNKGVGEVLTKEAAALGEAAGYFKTKDIGSGFVRIIGVKKEELETALNMYYANLVASLDATTDQINEAVLAIWDERGRKEALGSDLLSKASGMSYRELGEGLIDAGINLTADLLDQLINSQIIEKIAGTDQIRVKDFNAFANYIGVTDKDSQAYRDLYKQYVDSNIELATQAQEDVANAMSTLTDAKIGQKINLSNVFSGEEQRKYQIALEEYLHTLGSNFEDGILTVKEDTDLFGIAQQISSIAADAGIEITEAVIALSDAVQDAINGFADAIASGISGGITNAGKAEMINFTKRFTDLGVTLSDIDFVQTQDGLKLTTEKAIELYNALEKVSDVNTDGIFDALKESLFTRDNISDMTGVLGKIGELTRQITENQNKHGDAVSKTNKALQNELNLYQQIARSSMSDPDSYSFMSRKLPGIQQGPVNFWKDTSTMYNTMLSSAKSGYMAIEDFYAIVTSMQDIAEATGQTMSFMGYEIAKGTDAATKLIEAGYSNFVTAADHAGEIDLSGLTGIGVNLKTSAKDMAKGVEDGIHSYAASQVQMLDAAINILETVVAMEGISDAIDSEGTNITLEDLYIDINNKNKGIKPEISKAVGTFLEAAKGNEQMLKYLENIKLSGMSMNTILGDIADNGIIDNKDITDEMLLGTATFIKTLNSSGGFEQLYNNPEDVFNTLQALTLKIPGLTIEWQQGDTTYQEINGRKIWKDKDGKVVGTDTTNFEEGYKQIRLKEIQEEIKAINENRREEDQIITANGEKYTIKIDNDNIILEYDVQSGKLRDKDGKLYNSAYESVLAQYRKKAQESDGEFGGVKYKDMQDWQIEIAYNLKPAITINGIDELKNSPDILARILKSGKNAKDLMALSAEEQKIMFGAELNLDKDNINDLNKLLEDSKTLIKPKIAPVNADDIKIDGAVHVNLIADSITYDQGYLTFKTPNGQTVSISQGSENIFNEIAKQMGRQNLSESERKAIYQSLPTTVQQRYTPEGYEWTSAQGSEYAKTLLDIVNSGKELNATQRSAYLAYEKTLKNAVNIAEGKDWSTEATTAKQQVEADRKTWEEANQGSRLQYDYKTDSAWYKQAFEKGAGGQSLVDKFEAAYTAATSNRELSKWRTEMWRKASTQAGANASYNDIKEIYDRIRANAAIELEKSSSTNAPNIPTAAESAQALSNAATQQTVAAASLNAAAQALLGSTGDIGAALKQYGIDENQINNWINSNAISKDLGKQLIEQLNKESVSTSEEESQGNKDLLDENASLSAQNEELQSQLTEKSAQIAQLNTEINNLTQAKVTSEEEKANLVKQLADMTKQAENLAAELTDLTNQNTALQNEKNELSKQIADLQSQLDQARANLEETQRQLDLKTLAEEEAKKKFHDLAALNAETVAKNNADDYAERRTKRETAFWKEVEQQYQNNPNFSQWYLTEYNDVYNSKDINQAGADLAKYLTSLGKSVEEVSAFISEHLDQKTKDKQEEKEQGEKEPVTDNSALINSDSSIIGVNNQRLVFNEAQRELKTFEDLSNTPITPPVEPDTTNAVEPINELGETVIEPTVKPDTRNGRAQIKKDLATDVSVKVHVNYQTGAGLGGNLMITQATGNVALAAGTRTLMGELGPELVVSNGRYFVAGQNGAEFVDLDKDAIVFNHLQTQRLLANGSAGRGTPFTNARNATSLATGNVTGPAKASASAVLAQLKQVRALWERMANAPISDLAKKGGGGGGGGGNKETAGFIRDVERWYNWLQKIADLEKQITYQEQLRSKIQSDMVSSGDAYYKSQKKTYQDARDSALTSESLFLSQKEYFNNRRQQLNNSPLSDLYTFDETGQIHFQEGSYDWLANLFKTDDIGRLQLTAKQQYQAIIKRNANFAQYMQYDDSGKKINKKDYKSDDEYYAAMVKAFSDRMDAEQEEMQELFDSWNDQQKAVLEQMQAMNEQLQAMKDNQKEVEEAVLGAIEEMREREIEEMQNTRDALEETNQNFIDGLSNQLNKERQMYQNNQNDQELQRNRRQLAILQRSGASASQIAQMRQKIDKQSQDQYFEKQQEQIDAVKEASDNQIEKLDMQIELAQEQLEFEKAHGLLWGQVYEVMARTPQEITDFIKENTKEFWGKSPLANAEDLDNTLSQATQWAAFRDDVEMQNAAMGRIDQNLDIFMGALEQIYGKQANWDQIKKESEAKYKEYWGIDDEDPNATAWDAYPGKNDEIAEHITNTMGVDTSAATTSSGNSGGRTGLENKWYYNDKTHWKRLWNNGSWSKTQEGSHSLVTTGSKKTANGTYQGKKVEYYTVTKKCNVCGYTTNVQEIRPITGGGSGGASGGTTIEKPYAEGGVNDYTGLAMLHGTPSKPEGILNAEDYKAWKQDIKTTSLLYSALASVSATQRGAAAAVNSTTTNGGITIEHAEVSMNATIANDYDARRAGEQALEQMVAIARKSGTRSTQRR